MTLEDGKNGRMEKSVLPDGLEAPDGYLILENGVYKGNGDGVKMIATAPFYITGRLLNRERGEKSYIVELINEGEKETLLVKCTGGAKAIARAVEGAGVFLRGREVEEYIMEYLARNWSNMLVTDQAEVIEMDLEFESVYEQLVRFVIENEERFEEQVWGRFMKDLGTVCVRISVMNDFLGRVGILNKRKTLNFWKDKGVLHTDDDGRHLTRSVRIAGQLQRAYVISWQYGDNSDSTTEGNCGLKLGDTVSLVDLKNGDVLKVQLLEDPCSNNVEDSIMSVSVKSPLGKVLIGKKVGDAVIVNEEGRDEGEYKIISY
ncbi:MAG: GreA/GreB family elongation factor [Peptococcaceae bacterium]|nr:GreA/GreB family elongation factor [Peptococcaceae bacterium]